VLDISGKEGWGRYAYCFLDILAFAFQAHLSIYLSIYLSFHLSVYLSIYLHIYAYIDIHKWHGDVACFLATSCS
jgi:hypothetical protein